ncbi:MAG: FxDxF family PEP-CTERM protein, partial [Burkholderiales bacterium]|nr:FxDxF family PEP-CTERM protein [Burkholderiales bacterium]
TGGAETIYVGSSVSAIPEPETYAMMAAGLGLLGFVARRRKKTA